METYFEVTNSETAGLYEATPAIQTHSHTLGGTNQSFAKLSRYFTVCKQFGVHQLMHCITPSFG